MSTMILSSFNQSRTRLAGFGLLALLAPGMVSAAAPLVGTRIGNQASATYTDQSNTTRTATSNTVTTVVLQQAGLVLTQDNTRSVSPGGTLFFPHTVTNTGNGNDTYTLATGNVVVTNLDGTLANVKIYADRNQDGQPDDLGSPITSTGEMKPGESFYVVVGVTVPGTADSGDSASLDITATSTYTGSVNDTNTDSIRVSGDAVVTVVKSIDTAQGKPGTTPITYTLTYTNTGNTTATDVKIVDALPAGLTYVASSGRSSLTGTTVLTDDDTDGAQGSTPNGVDYGYDLATDTITVTLESIRPGLSGSITFQVSVDANIAPQRIFNTATYEYDPDGTGTGTVEGPFNTNRPPFDVLPEPSVTLAGDTVANARPGDTVKFSNVLTNTGTTTDTFDMTFVPSSSNFPAGTTFKFFQQDGNTPMVDSNNNGIPDTGPVNSRLAGGNTYTVVVQATLPTNVAGTGPFSIQKKATGSVIDSDTGNPATATTTDTLTAIVPPSVDLTNAAVSEDPDDGAGNGVGVTDGADYSTNPGRTIVIPLTVENEGSIVDAYDLTIDAGTIPTGWTVIIRRSAGGAVVSNSGTLQPPTTDDGGFFQYVAEVTVPAGQSPGDYNLTFRATSPVSAAFDTLINTVTVNTYREISLVSDNSGQVFPGGSVVYSHLLTNLGNVPEAVSGTSDITLGLADTEGAKGWTSVVILDANDNGVVDASDPIVTTLPDVDAPTFTSLGKVGSATSQVRLFVKVFAPLGVPNNAINITTVTATPSGTISGITAPAVVSNGDTTTVVAGDLAIVKEQALDTDNNGVADGSYTQLDLQALPGQSIIYRITVTNTGSADATNIVIYDTTPVGTSYAGGNGGTAVAQTDVGTVTTVPANGAKGSLEYEIGTLAPGTSAIVSFGVTIDQ